MGRVEPWRYRRAKQSVFRRERRLHANTLPHYVGRGGYQVSEVVVLPAVPDGVHRLSNHELEQNQMDFNNRNEWN